MLFQLKQYELKFVNKTHDVDLKMVLKAGLDELREMFIEFLQDEIDNFDNLCKFGKLKGWFSTPPMMKH